MHTIRFRDPAGAIRTGTFADGTIRFGEEAYTTAEVEILPPTDPTKIVCVGRNYPAHADEMGSTVPDRPSFFLKPPNALSGHRDCIPLPPGNVEYEAELAVVIGQQCRNVDPADADDVIAGYTCAVDLSNRTEQEREQNWVRAKAFDGAAPMGPVLADSVPDGARIQLWVNEDKRQEATIDALHFDVPALISAITETMTLEAGDVIMTGTPEGVGPLTDGDRVAVEIEGIGRLEHRVVQPE